MQAAEETALTPSPLGKPDIPSKPTSELPSIQVTTAEQEAAEALSAKTPLTGAAASQHAIQPTTPVLTERTTLVQVPPPGEAAFFHIWPVIPTVPWRVNELPDPRRSMKVDANTLRYRFCNKTHGPSIDEEHLVIRIFASVFQAAGICPNNANFSTRFIRSGRSCLIDVTIPNADHYSRTKEIKMDWHGCPMTIVASGPSMPHDQFIFFLTGLPSNASLGNLLCFLRRRFHYDLEIKDLWANFMFPAPGQRVFCGQVTVLACFLHGRTIGLAEMPGYLNFNGTELDMYF
ncbi:uncharacterized protein UTRI_05971 [Ustilago trichophora]|uniref:Uncharacterized protein n=1 Tax=Ustilago trichophora TaxID=86804 RepID=A0A5C3EI82_9BASI|nr:uncharacterized protein UTRI_05971 [Ustilago trichophora]